MRLTPRQRFAIHALTYWWMSSMIESKSFGVPIAAYVNRTRNDAAYMVRDYDRLRQSAQGGK